MKLSVDDVRKFVLWCHLWQCPGEIGSDSAERACDVISGNVLGRLVLIQQKGHVMSFLVMSWEDWFCFSRKGWTGEVGGCTQRVQMAWLSLDQSETFFGNGWDEKTVLLPCRAPISDSESFIPIWTSSRQLIAMTISSLLRGGCGSSHKCELDARTVV